jgi:hypothetical protein
VCTSVRRRRRRRRRRRKKRKKSICRLGAQRGLLSGRDDLAGWL